MMRAASLLLLLWVVAAVAAHAEPRSAEALLAEAAAAYDAAMAAEAPDERLARFGDAQRLYAAIAAHHDIRSASLYVNLGNAALQAHRPGPAVLAYRRALVLDPGDVQARENLAEARALLPTWVPTPRDDTLTATFFFWRHSMSRSARGLLAAVAFLVTALLLAAWIRGRRAWARNLAVLPALLWLALVALPLLDPTGRPADDGVVTADEAVLRSADSPGAPAKLAEPLPGGTEVAIEEARGDWARVRLSDGRTGWVARGGVTHVDPER